MLGEPVRERTEFAGPFGDSSQPRRKVHRGWTWQCGCVAFIRDAGDLYLLVPCVRHTIAQ